MSVMQDAKIVPGLTQHCLAAWTKREREIITERSRLGGRRERQTTEGSVWWYTPAALALQSLRQEDLKFKASPEL